MDEKDPSKNFVQPSKFFKSELMNSISQLPNHAPRKIGSLFDLEKKVLFLKKKESLRLSFLAFLPSTI